MSQWTTNIYGERVHKRQRIRRANLVYTFKKIIHEDNDVSPLINLITSIYTAKPKVKGAQAAYPERILQLYTFERKDKQQ